MTMGRQTYSTAIDPPTRFQAAGHLFSGLDRSDQRLDPDNDYARTEKASPSASFGSVSVIAVKASYGPQADLSKAAALSNLMNIQRANSTSTANRVRTSRLPERVARSRVCSR